MAQRDWWLETGTTSTDDALIVAPEIGARAVTSEKASVNLLTRTVINVLPNPAKGSDLGSTGFVVWRPTVPVTLQKILVVPHQLWSAVTSCGNFTIWSCAGGTLASYTACSTAFGPAVGDPFTVANLTGCSAGTLAAGASLLASLLAIGTCDDAPAHTIQIDYTTTA